MRTYSRRNALTTFSSLTGGATLLGLSGLRPLAAQGTVAANEDRRATEWFDAVVTKDFNKPLAISRFPDADLFYTTNEIKWTADPPNPKKHKSVTVPAGFVTDLASIPRVFWSILRPDGSYMQAAVVHDYLYWVQDRTRDASDDILDLGMEELSVPGWKRFAITASVKQFGQGSWDENSRRKGNGEKKVLAVVPTKPKTPWAEWKQVAKWKD